MNKGYWAELRAFFNIISNEGITIKGYKIREGINA